MVNKGKSKIFFSKNTDRGLRRVIANQLDMGSTMDLGKYLGVPLVHKRASPGLYRELIDRVQSRLSSWKAKILNLAGRATLIQSVTTAMPAYVMQSTWLPTSICNRLDKMNRAFLWATDGNSRKVHSVRWEVVTKAKKSGGLGIREARKINASLLAKIGWKILMRKDTIWKEIFRKKYMKKEDLLDCSLSSSSSPQWKGIIRSTKLVESHIRWRLGNGENISFWYDRWLGGEYLCDLIDRVVCEDEVSLRVNDLIDENRAWNLSKLRTNIPDAIKDRIYNVLIPVNNVGRDKLIWCASTNGNFSCASAYHVLRSRNEMEEEDLRWIWRVPCPLKIKHFIWLYCHGGIVTNSFRFDRGFATTDLCVRCRNGREDPIHALRDCGIAKAVWELIVMPSMFLDFMNTPANEWIKVNLKRNMTNTVLPDTTWSHIFLATVWTLWRSRNKVVFSGQVQSLNELIFEVKRLACDISTAFARIHKSDKKDRIGLKWELPPVGWCKLNCDGSYMSSSREAAAGGILRDDKGSWILGFCRKLGHFSITEAELLGLREGLLLAWERRIEKIIVEVDSEVVWTLVTKGNASVHPLGNIIEDCRILIHKPWTCKLVHILREKNCCADYLAKMGQMMTSGVSVMNDPPLK